MTLLAVAVFFVLLLVGVAWFLRMQRHRKTIAFFHPYCNAGGGGERVLWSAIAAMRERFGDDDWQYCVYTGDVDATPAEILAKAKRCFGVTVPENGLHFVYVRHRWLLEARYYPVFTLLMQSIGSILLGLEALWKLSPSVYVDTTGAAFTYPVFRFLAGSKVVCYVHYPTITKEMLALVGAKKASYNNAKWIATNSVLSAGKILYYRLFAFVYLLCGKCANVVMANGTWTSQHLRDIWRTDSTVVYPPCDVKAFAKVNSAPAEGMRKAGEVHIISVGQIRPEKNHRLQLEVLKRLNHKLSGPESANQYFTLRYKLHIAGGCRNAEDESRVELLKKYAANLGLEDDVFFHLNMPFPDMLKLMETCLFGIHTMWNEHFGISVVECLAAGLIMVAHKSGGPLLDIIGPEGIPEDQRCGFLAETAEEYAEAVLWAIEQDDEHWRLIRQNAQDRVERFSEDNFRRAWCDALERVLAATD
ncbi:glycosyl transferase [Aphelenchoides avenae]|nr:glycosyl transferase [Aphelenchus avenae]